MQTQDAAFWQIMFSTAPKHKARFIIFASLFFFLLLLYSNYSTALIRNINNTQSFTLLFEKTGTSVRAHTYAYFTPSVALRLQILLWLQNFLYKHLKIHFFIRQIQLKGKPPSIMHCMNKSLSFRLRKWRWTRQVAIDWQRALWWKTKDETTAVPCSQGRGRNCVAIGRASHWTSLLEGVGEVRQQKEVPANAVWAWSLYHLPRLKNKLFYTVKEKLTCNLKHLRQFTKTLEKTEFKQVYAFFCSSWMLAGESCIHSKSGRRFVCLLYFLKHIYFKGINLTNLTVVTADSL